MTVKAETTYFQPLDALRFFAFLAVFTLHTLQPLITGASSGFLITQLYKYSSLGFLGIDFFFVLSAFLIGYKLFEERENTNNFNLSYFLIRRVLRIWPLYFLIVAIGGATIYFNNSFFEGNSEMPPIHYFLLFLVNFYIAENGNFFLFFLVFLWSIAVEEQFYLIYSLLFKYSKRLIVVICVLLIIISILFRFSYVNDQLQLYYNTLSVVSDFSIGILLSYICYFRTAAFNFLLSLKKSVITFLYFSFVLICYFYFDLFSNPFAIAVERLVFACIFAIIIFEQAFSSNSVFKLGNNKVINYLGKISYGLYCFHGVVITMFIFLFPDVQKLGWQSAFTPLLILITTIGLSSLSYHFFEKKFLVLKNTFYPSF